MQRHTSAIPRNTFTKSGEAGFIATQSSQMRSSSSYPATLALFAEHDAQTTRPHFLQWCFLRVVLKSSLQQGQEEASESGCQTTRSFQLSLI